MVKFLCTADLHIGRQSSGFDGETALDAFGRIVDMAIDDRVDALLIAGDLFDGVDAQFMTRSTVAEGFERLKKEGIPVLAVAGNHDWDALPTFARAYPGLIELFDEGSWSTREVAGVSIAGRSFAGPTSRSLIGDFTNFGDPRVTIGLLHADVDAVSNYNPVPLSGLSGRGVQAWILGHVHASRTWQVPLVCYPGSPQALDAGETGIHGVRRLTVEGADVNISETVPLSSVRFEFARIGILPTDSIDDAIALYMAKVRAGEERLYIRLKLVRSKGCSQPVPEGVTALGRDFYEITDVVEAIEREIDLETEAVQTDARGQAARLLLGLDGKSNPAWAQNARALVSQVQTEMRAHRGKLKLDGREAFRVLAGSGEDEALQAVKASLESVLAATEGAR